MAFAVDFRRFVMPQLRTQCRKRAFFIALDMETFGEAEDAIMRQALARGAAHLSDDVMDDLREWIASTIVAEIAGFEPAIEASAAVADKVAADVRRKYFT